ncbi:MAG: integration host factor subunit beta [Treponema sp.]|nr:integration host factor subunit beta [Treponema sp.]
MPVRQRPPVISPGKFTKADIVDAVYEKTGMQRQEIRRVVDLIVDEIKYALVRREIIELRGFGTFEVKVRKARARARNPRTGENIVINSHGAVAFRAGRELKQLVWTVKDDETPK